MRQCVRLFAAKCLTLQKISCGSAILIFAHVVTHGAVSRQMVVLFLFVEVVTCIIGRVMRVSVSRLQRENTERRSEQ